MPNYEAVWKGPQAALKGEKNKWVVTEQYAGKKVPDYRVDMVHAEAGAVTVLGKDNEVVITGVKCDVERLARGRGPKGRIFEELLVCKPE